MKIEDYLMKVSPDNNQKRTTQLGSNHQSKEQLSNKLLF